MPQCCSMLQDEQVCVCECDLSRLATKPAHARTVLGSSPLTSDRRGGTTCFLQDAAQRCCLRISFVNFNKFKIKIIKTTHSERDSETASEMEREREKCGNAGQSFPFLWNIVTPITANKSFSRVRSLRRALSLSLSHSYSLYSSVCLPQ